jgi:hypothetical protein
MDQQGNGIRGPTGPDKANDRAGNAAVRRIDRGGSGTNQPSRVSRYVCLAPAASVGGGGADVKVGACGAMHADHSVHRAASPPRYEESGTPSDE